MAYMMLLRRIYEKIKKCIKKYLPMIEFEILRHRCGKRALWLMNSYNIQVELCTKCK